MVNALRLLLRSGALYLLKHRHVTVENSAGGGWGGDRGLRFRMGRSVMREISVCPAAYRMQPDAHVDEDQTISIHVLMKKTTVWNPQSIRVLPNV